MGYRSETDPYCIPGTTTLINRFGILDRHQLEEIETAMVQARIESPWPAGNLDKAHYLALHRHFFQDVYDWAGKLRTIRIGKGGNWFCFPDFIDSELDRLFADLRQRQHLRGLPVPAFAAGAAHFLGEVNAVHPFREGNGRTQLAFLRLLCLNAGYPFRAEVLQRERVIPAMIASFDGDAAPLSHLIADLIGG